MANSNILKLNIGGYKYYTSRSTLLTARGASDQAENPNRKTYFDLLLSGEFEACFDSEGEFLMFDMLGDAYERYYVM